MILRQLGYRVQELEAGPYRFLLSDGIPVAYSEDGQLFRVRTNIKAQTRHINQWLRGEKALEVESEQALWAFRDVSRFSDDPQARGLIRRLRQMEDELAAMKAELMGAKK